MIDERKTRQQLIDELDHLQSRLDEAEETLRAIRHGEVDAIVVHSDAGDQIYTLQGAEHPYRVMIESIAEGAATILPDSTILYGNHRLAEMLAVPLEKLIGQNLSTYIQPSDSPRYDVLIKNSLHGPGKDEIQFLCHNGSSLPVLLSLSPVVVNDIQGVSIVATDLTLQKQNDEIIAAEQLARSIFQQAVEAIVVCNAQGVIIRANTSAYQLSERTPYYLPFNKAYPLTIDKADPTNPDFSIDSVLKGATYAGIQAHFKPNSTTNLARRRIVHVQVSATPLKNEDDQIIGCVIILTDTSDLIESQERLSLATEAAEIGVWSWDLVNDKFSLDERTRQIFNQIDNRPLTYSMFIEKIHPDERLRVDAAIHDALASRREIEIEFPILWEDESRHLVNLKGKTYYSGIDTPERMTGVSMDVTARKKTEDEIHAQLMTIEVQHRLMDYREKERLQIARDLHDGPLQELIAISFAIQGLLTDVQGSPLYESIKMIQGSLLYQIGELRSFAGDLRPPSLSTFGIEFAIRSHLERFLEKYPEIKVTFESDPIGLSVPEAVRLAVFRVYQELMTNIIKHAQATVVEIRLLEKQPILELIVQDNGKGFDASILQPHGEANMHFGVLGMRERAEAVGGKLFITSTPGQGTFARLVVPFEKT